MIDMKLSVYARQLGISYKTAYRMWREGQLDAYQLPSGTVIIREQVVDAPAKIALYARVSSADQKDEVARQLDRLRNYAAGRGYRVAQEVVEIASGVNDNRPKLNKLLGDATIG